MKFMVVVWTCDDDQALGLEKKKEKNKMGSRQRYNEQGHFVFGDRDTIESVITFRIDGRTIKRGALIGQLNYLVPLGVAKLACAFQAQCTIGEKCLTFEK